jgi:hypothetical protein
MFKTAIKWRWLVENPAREIEAPPTRVKRQQRALSVEEVSLFVRRQLLLSISDNYFSLSTTITSFLFGDISPRLG